VKATLVTVWWWVTLVLLAVSGPMMILPLGGYLIWMVGTVSAVFYIYTQDVIPEWARKP